MREIILRNRNKKITALLIEDRNGRPNFYLNRIETKEVLDHLIKTRQINNYLFDFAGGAWISAAAGYLTVVTKCTETTVPPRIVNGETLYNISQFSVWHEWDPDLFEGYMETLE